MGREPSVIKPRSVFSEYARAIKNIAEEREYVRRLNMATNLIDLIRRDMIDGEIRHAANQDQL